MKYNGHSDFYQTGEEKEKGIFVSMSSLENESDGYAHISVIKITIDVNYIIHEFFYYLNNASPTDTAVMRTNRLKCFTSFAEPTVFIDTL